MIANRHPAELAQSVLHRLENEFGAQLASTDIVDTVRGAARDLEGQIVPEAFGEMLYRLACVRLGRAVRA
ncbi:hypothetical protein [Amycolatopsis thermophila]|uniref:Uncharacterized protein n=1 Tax=Amycolatopsis thermophila TaxID=206084 RepID=A0ABU0F5N8_9PSEU|nr:hypothetical protein [Amycolatopsis thermophila]MDQ0382907.1 hypothetical protein [Amycolatopsis thermophila]